MRYKILIIDELSPYLFFIKKVMENDNFEVIVSDNESEFSHIITEFSPEVILIELHMDNCVGFEFLKKIRNKYNFSAPIIVTSSSTSITEIEKAFELGAYDYLIKPLNLRDLKNKVGQAITKEKFRKNNCRA